ncbi:MAG: hypothetical protein ACRD20_20505 [Terriglobales bacterium]
MPKFLEKQLKAAAAKKGLKGKRADHYVYGAMNNMGAMRGNQETAKGEAMQRKHDAQKKMSADISKFRGSSSSYDHRRPVRKVVTRRTK